MTIWTWTPCNSVSHVFGGGDMGEKDACGASSVEDDTLDRRDTS